MTFTVSNPALKEKELENLKNEALSCKACELYKTRNQLVFSDGNYNAKCLFIGEAPGANEDNMGIPFIGRAGQLLRKFMFEVGFGQDDFYIANTLKCRPPQNRKPTKEEKRACENFLLKQIEIVNPKIIVLVGSTALESFVVDRLGDKKLTITKARGKIYEIEGRKYFPIFHPSYLLRYHSMDIGSQRYLFKEDLISIKKLIEE